MDDPIKIEKDVPVPEKQKVGRKAKYPFSTMEVGQSFTLPPEHDGTFIAEKSTNPRVATAAWSYGRRHSKRFKCRVARDGAVTIWRVE